MTKDHNKVTSINGIVTNNVYLLVCITKSVFCVCILVATCKRRPRQEDTREKEHMNQMCSLGYTVGEYVGNGKGDTESTEPEADSPDTEPVVDDQPESDEDNFEEGSSENAHPRFFFYDCETTGFSIYKEHITEIAAKVVGVPLSSLSQPTFSSLVKTSKNISKKGKQSSQVHVYFV